MFSGLYGEGGGEPPPSLDQPQQDGKLQQDNQSVLGTVGSVVAHALNTLNESPEGGHDEAMPSPKQAGKRLHDDDVSGMDKKLAKDSHPATGEPELRNVQHGDTTVIPPSCDLPTTPAASQAPPSTSGAAQVPATTPRARQVCTYKQTDCGPFYVFVEGLAGNVGRLHPMTLGKLLHVSIPSTRGTIINITTAGRNRCKIELSGHGPANELVKAAVFAEKQLDAYIPSFMVTSQGVIRHIDPTLEEQEILTETISECKVLAVRRFTKRVVVNGDAQHINLQTCVLTFASQSVPHYVYLHGTRCEVTQYVPPVKMCYHCLRYGHMRYQCRSASPRCVKCGGQHTFEQCDAELPSCVHCHGAHLATDRGCPVYIQQQQMKEFATFNNVTYRDAQLLLQGGSYAQAAAAAPYRSWHTTPSTQGFSTTPDIRDRSSFPPLRVSSSSPIPGPSRVNLPPQCPQQPLPDRPQRHISFPRPPRCPPTRLPQFPAISDHLYRQRDVFPTTSANNPYPPQPHRMLASTTNHTESLIEGIFNLIVTLLSDCQLNSPPDPLTLRNMIGTLFTAENGV